MKQITRVLRAGLLPERLINDGKASTFVKLMFPILTLYAVPDETGEEWEFNLKECNEKWLPIGRDKIIEVLQQMGSLGYVEDLDVKGASAIFSFPDWVMKMLGASASAASNETKENPPDPPFGKGGKEETGEAVHRAGPPAGYALKTDKKGHFKCSKCKKIIAKGESYFYKGGRGNDRLHPVCAGGGAAPRGLGPAMREAAAAKVQTSESEKSSKIPAAVAEVYRVAEAAMKKAHDDFIHPELGEIKSAFPRNQAIINLVGADLSLVIIRALHVKGNISGDAFEVIDLTRGIIVNYLEVMPEL